MMDFLAEKRSSSDSNENIGRFPFSISFIHDQKER